MMRTALLAALALLAVVTLAAPAQADHITEPSSKCYRNDRLGYTVCTYQEDTCVRAGFQTANGVRGWASTPC